MAGLKDVTYETLALRLESARSLGHDHIVLSSYHSAKGSEFEAVFILDERRPGDENDDVTRALYVALTRARERLYLIRKVGGCHSAFGDLNFMEEVQRVGVQPSAIDKGIKLPERITFTSVLQPGELWVSSPEVVKDDGRRRVDQFARQWLALKMRQGQTREGKVFWTFSSSEGVVARAKSICPAAGTGP